MLEIVNISKNYKSKIALSNTTVSMTGSQIVGLVGPNGSGKTTLLKSITGVCRPTTGEIRKNQNVTIGLVMDDLKGYDNRTLKFNLEYFRIVKGLDSYNESLKVLEILNFDLSLLDSKLKTFSYGMYQKVIVAISLMSSPEIVLLDEPFRGLDEHSVQCLKNLLNKYKEEGKLILFSSHNIDDVERICDKVIVLNSGNLMGVVDSKVAGNASSITFNTSNNDRAYMLISAYNPIIEDGRIRVELADNQWKEILRIMLDNDIEVLGVDNNSSLSKRLKEVYGGVRHV